MTLVTFMNFWWNSWVPSDSPGLRKSWKASKRNLRHISCSRKILQIMKVLNWILKSEAENLINMQKHNNAECFFFDLKDGLTDPFPSLALRECNDVCFKSDSLEGFAEYVMLTFQASLRTNPAASFTCTTPGKCQNNTTLKKKD